MIRPGWKVYASDGTEVGAVDEVAGDDTEDIFNGLAVTMSALGRTKYVPAERVTTYTEERGNLTITRGEVAGSDVLLSPATYAMITTDRYRVMWTDCYHY